GQWAKRRAEVPGQVRLEDGPGAGRSRRAGAAHDLLRPGHPTTAGPGRPEHPGAARCRQGTRAEETRVSAETKEQPEAGTERQERRGQGDRGEDRRDSEKADGDGERPQRPPDRTDRRGTKAAREGEGRGRQGPGLPEPVAEAQRFIAKEEQGRKKRQGRSRQGLERRARQRRP